MSDEKKTRQELLQEKLDKIKTDTDKNGRRKTLEAVEQEIWKLHSDTIKMLVDIDLELEQIRRYATSLKSVASKQAQTANTSSAS